MFIKPAFVLLVYYIYLYVNVVYVYLLVSLHLLSRWEVNSKLSCYFKGQIIMPGGLISVETKKVKTL